MPKLNDTTPKTIRASPTPESGVLLAALYSILLLLVIPKGQHRRSLFGESSILVLTEQSLYENHAMLARWRPLSPLIFSQLASQTRAHRHLPCPSVQRELRQVSRLAVWRTSLED